MPIPTPNKDETESKFISRCMSDSKMINEFPKKTQRSAVCYDKWNSRKKSLREIVAESIKQLSGNCGCNKK